YVFHAYKVTHSLVVWVAVLIISWTILRKQHPSPPPSPFKGEGEGVRVWDGRAVWPLGAWGLHILCDIPTHSTRFFPTPFLWPFPTPYYNGTSWGNKTFMLANYAGIALTYLVLVYRKSKLHPFHGAKGA